MDSTTLKNQTNKPQTVRIVDLFSGIGGLRQGAVNALTGLGHTPEVVFTSEIKKHAILTHEANWPDEIIHGDITKIAEADIPEHDLLLAGFPCQAFSSAGLRQGFADETKGTLFFDVLRVLKHHKPERFILENVEGLVTHDRDPATPKSETGRTLDTIITNLENLGYSVDWKVITATSHGIPQARKRIFITGNLHSPADLTKLRETAAQSLQDVLEENPTVEPETASEKQFQDRLFKHYNTEELTGKIIRNNRGGPNNIHAWDFGFYGEVTQEEKDFLDEFMKEQKRTTHAKRKGVPAREKLPLNLEDIQTFNSNPNLPSILQNLTRLRYLTLKDEHYTLTGGKLSFPYSQILDTSKPTPTIVASDADRLAVIHEGRLRRLTTTELKRLFGFPDDYIIPDSIPKRAKYDLFGNSVVTNVAAAVTETLY